MSDLSPARTGSSSRVRRSSIKCNRVSIYLSNAELDAVIQKLQLPMGTHPFSVGRAIADHFRRSEMNQRPAPVPAPEVNRYAWATLARTTANLNQLTHAINSGKASGVDVQTLETVRVQVENLRCALLGLS
jgi:hypothetical protein